MTENRQILLVEDDALIALMLADMLEALGFSKPVQAATLEEAEAAIAAGPIAAALIDVNIGEEKVWPFADRLAQSGIAFAFTTGGGDVVPAAHLHRKLVSKPFRLVEIDSVLQELLGPSGSA